MMKKMMTTLALASVLSLSVFAQNGGNTGTIPIVQPTPPTQPTGNSVTTEIVVTAEGNTGTIPLLSIVDTTVSVWIALL